MSKIKLDEIKAELEKDGWKLLSETYKNLDEELVFECAEGHKVYGSWRKMRKERKCPICGANELKNITTKVMPRRKGMNRVIGLDQATRLTGWSVYDGNELIKYGIFRTDLDDEIARDHEIKEWLINMVTAWSPDCVGIEGIQYQQNMGVTTFETLARLQGILMETLYEKKIAYKICPTNTWRAHCNVKGRSLPNDMLIPTTDGFKTVEEIKIGDFLFDRLGNPTKVLKIYSQGILPVWKVTFVDGRTIECSGDHLWSYHTHRQRKNAWNNNIFKTLSTEELSKKNIYAGNSKSYNLLVPYCSMVQFSKQNLKIPPYVLGACLGDGSFRLGKKKNRVLQFSSKDEILPKKIASIMNWTVKHSAGNYTYYFCDNNTKKNIRVIDFLKDYPNLINASSKDKSIPLEYMIGSIDQRIELLQGLLDTDGTSSRGRVKFTTISLQLAQQVQQLSFSLGLSASITLMPPRGFGKQNSYIIAIYGNPVIKQKLFTLNYKKDNLKYTSTRQYKTNAIIKIEKTNYNKPMTCFLVDNKENLFLAKDYIVTHNTRSDKKASMQRLVKEWFDISITDDEADAIGIGKFLSEVYYPTQELIIENWE